MTTQTLGIAEPEALRFGYGDTALGTIVVAESMRGAVVHGSVFELKETCKRFQNFTHGLDETEMTRVRNWEANCDRCVTTYADFSPGHLSDKA